MSLRSQDFFLLLSDLLTSSSILLNFLLLQVFCEDQCCSDYYLALASDISEVAPWLLKRIACTMGDKGAYCLTNSPDVFYYDIANDEVQVWNEGCPQKCFAASTMQRDIAVTC